MKNLKMGFLLFLLCCSTVFANDYGNIVGIVKDSEIVLNPTIEIVKL